MAPNKPLSTSDPTKIWEVNVKVTRISKAKTEILETLWRSGKPLTIKEISERVNLKRRSVNMHMLKLKNAGYVSSPERGSYIITEAGKEQLGLPALTIERAKFILREVPAEKAFHFYAGIGRPLGVTARSLSEFCEKILSVDLESVIFHMKRGDFELWIHYLGDVELAKRLRHIRDNLTGEDLRKELHETIKARCQYLKGVK